jgi:L-threonylcarbamoyladenylate synthase
MRVRIDPDRIDSSLIDRAVTLLRSERLVAFPTETVYGLGALGTSPVALMRIFEAKGRPSSHPLILHVLSIDDAERLVVEMPVWARLLAKTFWPGPLTFVIPKSAQVPFEATGGQSTVALRAPSNPIARALLRALQAPIAAPSANLYQQISATHADHVERSLGDRIDLLLDGGPCSIGLESTVIGEAPEGGLTVLRPGSIAASEIRQALPNVMVRIAEGLIAKEAHEHASPGLDKKHYAPRTRMVISNSIEQCVQSAHLGPLVGVLSFRDVVAPSLQCSFQRALGATPERAGRSLYSALHEADQAGLNTILVEAVPRGPQWAAIRDRLSRAASEFIG